MRIGRALEATVVGYILLVGCGGSHRLPVSPDAAVRADVVGAETRDLPAAPEEVGVTKDAASDPSVGAPTPDAGAREAEPDEVLEAGRDTRGIPDVAGELGRVDAGGAGAADVADAKATDTGASEAGGANDTGGPEVCAQITCLADFPCAPDQQPSCAYANPKAIVHYKTVSCAVVCGTPCCSGGQCRSESEDCPAGTVCAYPSVPTSAAGAKAECIDETRACGGADNKRCASGQYCEHWETLCSGSSCPGYAGVCDKIKAGGLGICPTLPASSSCDTTNPVCGCDGKTYENECARKIANVARAYTGACSAAVSSFHPRAGHGTGAVSASGGAQRGGRRTRLRSIPSSSMVNSVESKVTEVAPGLTVGRRNLPRSTGYGLLPV